MIEAICWVCKQAVQFGTDTKQDGTIVVHTHPCRYCALAELRKMVGIKPVELSVKKVYLRAHPISDDRYREVVELSRPTTEEVDREFYVRRVNEEMYVLAHEDFAEQVRFQAIVRRGIMLVDAKILAKIIPRADGSGANEAALESKL